MLRYQVPVNHNHTVNLECKAPAQLRCASEPWSRCFSSPPDDSLLLHAVQKLMRLLRRVPAGRGLAGEVELGLQWRYEPLPRVHERWHQPGEAL